MSLKGREVATSPEPTCETAGAGRTFLEMGLDSVAPLSAKCFSNLQPVGLVVRTEFDQYDAFMRKPVDPGRLLQMVEVSGKGRKIHRLSLSVCRAMANR